MVGGAIVDYYNTGEMQGGNPVIRFLVKDQTYSNTCCVSASIPESVIPEIKKGDNVWWQSKELYLSVFACYDVPFLKYGYSGGDAKSFYNAKLKTAVSA